MAGKRDIIWVADAIVTQLRASLSAKLDALDTEYADGITMENVPAARMFIAEHRTLPTLPFIVVLPDDTDALPFTGEERYDMEMHQLDIAISCGGNMPEDRLKRISGRYVRALQEVMIDNRTLSG